MRSALTATTITRSSRSVIVAALCTAALLLGACSGSAEVISAATDTSSAATTVAPAQASAAPEVGVEAQPDTNDEAASVAAADPAAAAADDSTSIDPAAIPTDLTAEECQAVSEAGWNLAAAASSLPHVSDAESFESVIFNLPQLWELIDVMRPYQDVASPPFGTGRTTLDLLASDLTAATEGRFGDMVKDYDQIHTLTLVHETICV